MALCCHWCQQVMVSLISTSISGYRYSLSLVRRGCQPTWWSLESPVHKLVLACVEDISIRDPYGMTTDEWCVGSKWLPTNKHVTSKEATQIHKECARNRYAFGCHTVGISPDEEVMTWWWYDQHSLGCCKLVR